MTETKLIGLLMLLAFTAWTFTLHWRKIFPYFVRVQYNGWRWKVSLERYQDGDQ